MPRHGGPALVVDAAVAEHLEVLRRPPVVGFSVVECVPHAYALDRLLRNPVHGARLGDSGCVEDGRRDVDHVVELRAHLARRVDAVRPVHDRPVAGSAPMRRDLLRPLVRRVQRVRPADGVVVVRLGRAEVLDPGDHELGRLEPGRAVQDDELVEAAVRRAFRRGAVVADDVVDERVLEDPEVAERIDQPADVVVGVLEEPGVDLHLPCEHGLQVVRHVLPGGDLRGTIRELRVGRNHAQFLLARKRPLAERIPAVVELALVFVRPLRCHVVRGVRGAGREVDEERLVGHERLLLADPVDRLVGHVLGEVVALLRRLLLLHGHGVAVDRRRVLVRLSADEAVEVVEARSGRPRVERSHRARLPDGDLVTLPELRGRVAVEPQRLRERRARLGADRVVAGSRGRDLRDAAHADRVVVPAREQRLPRRRAERRRMEAVELEAVRCEPLGSRRRARPAERARRREADVVEEDDEDVRRAIGRT